MSEDFAPTVLAAQARMAAVRPVEYGRTRNFLEGAVTGLSPWITHGLVSLPEVLAGVSTRCRLDAKDKFIFQLGWRAYFRHVWLHRGDGIFISIHEGVLPDSAYSDELPADIRQGRTGVPAIDAAVRTLYATGMLHNHARMWLASYVVHLRKVHWRIGADWLYGHLLDGDLASNHLSWQWVAATGSSKPYLFNADNVARYAPAAWRSPGTVIDCSYETLDQMARQPSSVGAMPGGAGEAEPELLELPPAALGLGTPDAQCVQGRDVWLVHAWNLGALPADLPAQTLVIGIFVADFHCMRPWAARRWQFAGTRMSALAAHCWFGDAAQIRAALAGARSVCSISEPHLAPWLAHFAECRPPAELFAAVERRCDSFSKWWKHAADGDQAGQAALGFEGRTIA